MAKTVEALTSARQPSGAPYLGTVALIALSGLVPLWIISSTQNDGYPSWWLALISLVIAGARFSWILASSQRRLFEMTTWLFFYAFMGAAPLVQLRNRVDPGTTRNLDHSFDETALTMVIVAEIALILGSTLARARADKRLSGQRTTRSVHEGRTKLFSYLTLVLGITFAALVGVSALFDSRQGRSAAIGSLISDPTIRGIVTTAVPFMLLMAVIAQLHLRRMHRYEGRRSLPVLLFVSICVLLVIVNPIGSPRFSFITVIAAILAALGLFSAIRVYRLISFAALGAIVFIFPLLDTFRLSTDASVEAVDPLRSLSQGDFDSFGQIVNTAWLVGRDGVTWGYQFLGPLFFWVPRSVWPGKPVDTGILLAEEKGYWFTNLSAPLPAELFINGGWPVLLIGMGVLGYWLRLWDRSSELQIAATGLPTVIGCVMPFFFILILRGSLLQATANLAIILVCAHFVTRRQPVRGTDGGQAPTPMAATSGVSSNAI